MKYAFTYEPSLKCQDVWPEGPAPKGHESLAQGSPWVSRDKRFALKGLKMRTRSGSKIRSRFSSYLVATSGHGLETDS